MEPQKVRRPRYEPKWLYHKDKGSILVKSHAHESSLGDGWEDTPAKHGVVTHPLSAEQEFGSDPEEFFDDEHEIEEEVAPPPKAKGRKKQE